MSEPTPDRDASLDLLRELTVIPTAAGREQRVIDRVIRWVGERDTLTVSRDPAGNMVIAPMQAPAGDAAPLFITAHLDHPAFVVEASPEGVDLTLAFRGGVRDPYFPEAEIEVITRGGRAIPAHVLEASKPDPFRACTAELEDATHAGEIAPGDIARWRLPEPSIEDGLFHTHACDDLAAVASALMAMDAVSTDPRASHVRLLFTRAEEVGFVGAIAACRNRTMPEGSRAILLENSRSFADSPIGGGPIVRVGDRMTTFSPTLTSSIAKLAQELGSERGSDAEHPFRWQRKLMPGGACEATCFQAYGYDATCLCLPLGNYHNMANLTEVETGGDEARDLAVPGREYIALDDYHNLTDLLIALATRMAGVKPMRERLDELFEKSGRVLDEA